ncbi:hypothetical protein DAI22_03g122200 [Oryza sativa Japonica Group]|nr:hypothetical protein DAI22_03g122200 [Oryza sativa Japonica Group]
MPGGRNLTARAVHLAAARVLGCSFAGPERRVCGRRPNNKVPVDNWAPVRFLSSAAYLHKTANTAHSCRILPLRFSAHLLVVAADCAPMAQAVRPCNATLLARLRDGEARFELLEDSAAAAAASPAPAPVWPGLSCFSRVATSLRGGWSGALNKVEHYGVQRVTGDGRCMFRALVKGMAKNKGIPLTSREEVQDADDLRMAVKEVICDDETERQKYEEAVIAITVDESLRRFCLNCVGSQSLFIFQSVSTMGVEMVLFL